MESNKKFETSLKTAVSNYLKWPPSLQEKTQAYLNVYMKWPSFKQIFIQNNVAYLKVYIEMI